jgi:hypothetical protein
VNGHPIIVSIFIPQNFIGMKKLFFFLVILSTSKNLLAQIGNVGIGTTAPHPSARLEVAAANKGLLIPRVKLKSDSDIVTISNPLTSLLVFNSRDTANVLKGFYYWNDSVWVNFTTELNISNSESVDWRVKGNVVQPAVQFIGSTNSAAVPFRLNNTHSGVLGFTNTSFGYQTMALQIPGASNVAFGKNTLQNIFTSNFNTAIGDEVLKNFEDDGTGRNTGVGYTALLNTNGNSAAYNTAVGASALSVNVSGYDNTALGYDANTVGNNLNNITVIGSGSRVSSINTMAFGNSAVEKWVFGRQTSPANQALKVGTGAGNGNGAYLTDGGAWTNTSDKNLKEDITPTNGDDILKKIMALPMNRWKYKGTSEYHIGPMAQDFYAAFKTGLDETAISTIDPAGVALAAIQQLKKENDTMAQKIELVLKLNEELKQQLTLLLQKNK